MMNDFYEMRKQQIIRQHENKYYLIDNITRKIRNQYKRRNMPGCNYIKGDPGLIALFNPEAEIRKQIKARIEILRWLKNEYKG